MSIKTDETPGQLAIAKLPATAGKRARPRSQFDQGAEADIEEAGLSEEEPDTVEQMTPTPDPLTTSARMMPSAEEASRDDIDAGPAQTTPGGPRKPEGNDSPKRRKTELDEAALFNT